MRYVKLWGLAHSGTNYFRFVAEENFDVRVLTSILGWKHSRPYLSNDWRPRSWFPLSWSPAQQLYMRSLEQTVKGHLVKLPAELKASIEEARAAGEIQHVLLIREPYDWIVSMAKERMPGIRRLPMPSVRLLLLHWVDMVRSYLAFAEKHDSARIVPWEDTRDEDGLVALGHDMGWETKHDGHMAIPSERVLKQGDKPRRLSDRRFDAGYFERERYMALLSQEQVQAVNDVCGELIEQVGYRRRNPASLGFNLKKVRRPERWWDMNIDDDNEALFMTQTGWEDNPQRQRLRALLRSGGYQSMLDCGGGPGVEWQGIKADGISLDYACLEVTERFLADCERQGIRTVRGSVSDIPEPDSSYDLVGCRHVLEHVGDWKKALAEMVRVARRAIFIQCNKPLGKRTVIRKDNTRGLWVNIYGKADFLGTLRAQPGVAKVTHQHNEVEVLLD